MTTSFKNQIVGLVRFSFATKGDFYPGFDTVEAMENFLFDPARLARRFHLFESLCLPALRQQTDQDFTCLFLVGANMPKRWQDHLQDLLAPLPSARICLQQPETHYSAIRRAFATVAGTGYTHRTSFRLDDDDAFDNGYVARLRSHASGFAPLCDAGQPFALAFNRGFYIELKDGDNDIYDATERTPLSVGAALVTPISYHDNIYVRNHRALPQFFDAYSDATSHVFLRSIHRDNKSDPHFSGARRKMPPEKVAQAIRDHFGRDVADLRKL